MPQELVEQVLYLSEKKQSQRVMAQSQILDRHCHAKSLAVSCIIINKLYQEAKLGRRRPASV